MTSTESYLFDIKAKMPDEVYIQLMNNLKKDFENKNESKYAKLTIVKIESVTSSHLDQDDDEWHHSSQQVRTKVVKIVTVSDKNDDNDGSYTNPFTWENITNSMYKVTLKNINNYGYYDYSTRFETYIITKLEDVV